MVCFLDDVLSNWTRILRRQNESKNQPQTQTEKTRQNTSLRTLSERRTAASKEPQKGQSRARAYVRRGFCCGGGYGDYDECEYGFFLVRDARFLLGSSPPSFSVVI